MNFRFPRSLLKWVCSVGRSWPRDNHPSRVSSLTGRALEVCPALEELEHRRVLSSSVSLGYSSGIAAYSGVGFQNNEVAVLNGTLNNETDTNIKDFSATIQWGDGSSTDAVLAPNPAGSSWEFQVKGSHVYTQAGNYDIVVDAFGPDGTSTTLQSTNAIVLTNPQS